MSSYIGMTAVELAAMVQRGEATAEAVVSEHVVNARSFDANVNALTVQRGERALADARAVDARPDRATLPLAGVPVVVKDSVDVVGEMTRHGSRGGSTVPVAADEPTVARLRAAGAVIIAKTTMSEFGAWPFTESKAWGWTLNPWNRDRSPGGSSGGSAVAVSMAAAPLGLGIDGGGSIRVPAACCGLVGLKPGMGVVPISDEPRLNWFGLAEEGPLATTVADAALMYDVLAGTKTPVSSERRLRVALSLRSPLLGVTLDPRIREAVLATAYTLERAGHRVFRVDPPYPLTVALPFMRRWLAAVGIIAKTMPAEWLESRTKKLAAIGRFLQRFGDPCPKSAAAWRQTMDTWFGDYDVLICPVTAVPPPKLGYWDRRGLLSTFIATTRFIPYTPAWNLAGYPCASVPTGEQADKVPIGVQLVAPRGHEATILSVAAHIEQLRPWPRHAPQAQVAVAR